MRSGIVQSVPCTAAILWSIVRPHLSSNRFWLVHQSYLVAAETPSNKAGSWREIFLNLADEVSLSYSAGFFNMPQNIRNEADVFNSSMKEVVLWVLSSLKSVILGRVWRVKSFHICGPQRSLPCSQKHKTDPILTLYLFKVNTYILAPTRDSSMCYFYFVFSE
jgi:hypothetical protein